MESPALRHNRNFRNLLASDAVSHAGTQITLLALPVIAVVTLEASPLETGYLRAAQTAAFLLVGLPAGVWVDRLRRRPIMIASDLVRAALLLSLPAAWLVGVLTLPQLYLVAFGMSVATVFFDVAHRSYLPTIVTKDQLVGGNSALETAAGVSRVAGPGVGGMAVQWLGGPLAVLADAASFLVSALFLGRIKAREAGDVQPPSDRPGLWGEIREGLGFVMRDRYLRAIALSAAISNGCGSAVAALEVVFMIDTVGVSVGLFGVLLTAGAVGGVLGAMLSAPLTRWVGQARIVFLASAVLKPFDLLIPLTTLGAGLTFFAVPLLAGGVCGVLFNVAQASFRMAITPDRLLGRMTATMRFIAWGVLPLGAAAGGLLGEVYGTRTALWIAVIVQLLCLLPLIPLARLRDFPEA